MVTLDDIALAVGVSKSTVSRTLNGRETKVPVTAETRERILAVARELDYRPNHFARSLRTKRSQILGIAIRDFTNPFWGGLLNGIIEATSALGYHAIVHNVASEQEQEETASLLVTQLGVDALLLVGDFPGDQSSANRIAERYPTVALCRDLDPGVAPRIAVDSWTGLQLVMSHLLQFGHRRIGFVGLAQPPGFATRYEAYREFMGRHRLPMTEDLIHLIDLDHLEFPSEDQLVAFGNAGAEHVLHACERIDALVCACDPMALGAIRAIEQAGLSVPGDVSVAGFDNAPLARWCRPPLTTVHHPVTEMGRAAAALAIELVERGSAQDMKKEVLFPPELVVRESTGAASLK